MVTRRPIKRTAKKPKVSKAMYHVKITNVSMSQAVPEPIAKKIAMHSKAELKRRGAKGASVTLVRA